MENLQYLGAFNNLVPQLVSRETYHAQIYCVSYKGIVIHKFVTCKRANCVQEEICGFLEVTNRYAVCSLIDFQAISSVPVATFFYQAIK